GKKLSALIGYDFHDSDSEVESRTGVDISFVFEKEGEEGFRRRERDAIDDLTKLNRVVLATGGGAVLESHNRQRLAERGFVVYLRTSVDQQFQRVRHSKDRPLLQGVDTRQALEELAETRNPLYEQLADHCMNTDGRRVDVVARELQRVIEDL
ncbi:MAG: shikimate kinase, partial [Pseudomonadota bacterium]